MPRARLRWSSCRCLGLAAEVMNMDLCQYVCVNRKDQIANDRDIEEEQQWERESERKKELFLSESSSFRDDLFPSVQETNREKTLNDGLIRFIPRSRDLEMNVAIRFSTLRNEGRQIDLPRGVS